MLNVLHPIDSWNSKNGKDTQIHQGQKRYFSAAIWVVLQNSKFHCYGSCFMDHLREWIRAAYLDNHPWFLVPTKIFLLVENRTRQVNLSAACYQLKSMCQLIKWEWHFHKKYSRFVQITHYDFVNFHIANKINKMDRGKQYKPKLSASFTISKKNNILLVI